MAAVFDSGASVLTVMFDRPLLAGVLDASNWMLRYASTTYSAVSASASGVEVSVLMAVMGVQLGPNVTSYAPPPFDVRSAGGEPAAAFSHFPVQ